MEIRPLDRASVEGLIERMPLGSYLQSAAWNEFQKSFGRNITHLGAFEGSELRGSVAMIRHDLVMNRSYLYIPHGPLAADAETFGALVQAVIVEGKKQGVMFIKIDVPLTPFEILGTTFADFVDGTALQPRHTQVLNPQLSDEELLAGMHPKARYNLRLAEKKGVKIRWSTNDEDFHSFIKLEHATFTRQGIRMHPDRYYELMFQTLRQQNMIELGIAEYEGQPIAINEIVWCGKTATYLHGGSSDQHKNVMAPYLLQWETVQRARQRGMADYDLRGIAPADEPEHKLAGVTRFKVGLGGKMVVYPVAKNYILQPSWYWAYRTAKRLRGGSDD